MSKRSRENRQQRTDQAESSYSFPPPFYWLTMMGVAFLAGFVLAALIFSTTTPSPEGIPTLSKTLEPRYTAAEVKMTLSAPPPLIHPGAVGYESHHTEDGDPALGPEDATVTVIEYSDFSCGFCRRFYNDTLPLLLEEYSDRVRFVYRDAPVLGAYQAAIAAECADEQGRFWEYHDALFTNPNAVRDEAQLVALAETVELDDIDAFESCLTSEATRDEVDEDFEAARAAGVTGTPSFTINGELIIGAKPIGDFRRTINTKLEGN